MAIVNSTTPKFGPKWPPDFETCSIKKLLISLASCATSPSFKRLTSAGELIWLSILIV